MWDRFKTWWKTRKLKRLVPRFVAKYGAACLRDGLIQQGYILVSQETTADGWIALLRYRNSTVIIEDRTTDAKRRTQVTSPDNN